ncbi:MAG: hypothetical protein LBP85_06375 [Prevotellaceae bacterium]|jgi:hypothetical protein|nr:hypothetical protein [Prevotellaceae bacterium]
MTTHKDWLPKNHEALYNQATQTKNYLTNTAVRVRIGISATTPIGKWYDEEFVPKYNDFAAAFANWQNPAERTPTKTLKLAEAEEAFKETYRKLYTGVLRENPLVTDDDLNSMGLPLHSSGGRTPSPVPDSNPDADIDTSQIRRIKIHFYEDTGAHKKAKPAGVHGAEVRWQVFDTQQEVHIDDLINSSFDTNSPLTIDFNDSQRGKFFYFALRWENTRGEKGPFGPILNAIIP